MNNWIFTNILRFVTLFIFQVFIFKRIAFNWEDFAFIHFVIYPLAILLLPIKTPRITVMLIAFIYGMGIDVFYDSPGIHASAAVFTAYVRGIVLKIIEPYEGYNSDDSPTIKTCLLYTSDAADD